MVSGILALLIGIPSAWIAGIQIIEASMKRRAQARREPVSVEVSGIGIHGGVTVGVKVANISASDIARKVGVDFLSPDAQSHVEMANKLLPADSEQRLMVRTDVPRCAEVEVKAWIELTDGRTVYSAPFRRAFAPLRST